MGDVTLMVSPPRWLAQWTAAGGRYRLRLVGYEPAGVELVPPSAPDDFGVTAQVERLQHIALASPWSSAIMDYLKDREPEF